MRFLRTAAHVVLLLLACGIATAAAAADTARVEGRVSRKGTGVGGVVVLINELKLIDVTRADGHFVFERVPLGTYTVLLTLGDNVATQVLLATEAGTVQVEYEVTWQAGVREEVTVSATPEQLAKTVDAPAAVTSIGEKQIEQQASHGQVPKVLEFTPGAEITQSGLYDFNFNTRGFNSSLNRRVSTYIDGRDVGVVLLGAQEWAAISGALDDVSHLEFVRGPSAALYGANASSGVVNITTKAPRGSLGTLLRETVGELNTQSLDFRRADHLGGGWYSKITAGLKDSGDYSISRNPDGSDGLPGTGDELTAPEYATFCRRVGETGCLLEERTLPREQDNEIRYGSLRLDKYLTEESVLTFEAGISDIAGPVFQTGIGRVQILDAERPFFRAGLATKRWNVIGHYTSREGDQLNLTKDLALLIEGQDLGSLDTDDQRYGVEAQGTWSLADERVRVVAGAAYTREHVDTGDRQTAVQTVLFEPVTTNREAVYGQADWQASERFKFVLAGRVDWNTLHDPQFSPKAAVVFGIDSKNSLRLTYNEAFQVANYSEFFLHARIAFFPIGSFENLICGDVDCGLDEHLIEGNFLPILAVGNDDLELEETQAWELGYSGLLADRVFVTVDYYNSRNENFITDLVPQVGTILGNLEGCVPEAFLPGMDPNADPRTRCPINGDYGPWVSTPEAETTLLFPPFPLTMAQALRNAVQRSVGGEVLTAEGEPLGFRMAEDLDGSPVIIGRTYTNVGRVDTQGVDFGVQYFLTRELNLQASYSWFDFEIVDSDVEIEEILLPNTPRHKASLAVSLTRKRWSASVGGRWVDDFRWSAGVFQGDVPEYYTVDLAGSYGLSAVIRVGFNVANLTDNVHRETFGGDELSRRALAHLTFTFP